MNAHVEYDHEGNENIHTDKSMCSCISDFNVRYISLGHFCVVHVF